MNYFLAGILSLSLLAGCSGKKTTTASTTGTTTTSSSKAELAPPADAELAAAKKTWPSASAQSLNDGYVIYTTKCTRCHGLKDIPSRSETQWKNAIDRMAPKAKLTDAEKESLSQFLLSAREVRSGK